VKAEIGSSQEVHKVVVATTTTDALGAYAFMREPGITPSASSYSRVGGRRSLGRIGELWRP
jgi:hypothetical protein